MHSIHSTSGVQHPMLKTKMEKERIYHICNRAVEGRKIFSTQNDCVRFLKTVLLVNNAKEVFPPSWQLENNSTPDVEEPLVEIYAFALMPDHFHILGKQYIEDGVSRFLQRLCNSYGKYYNQRYERRGPLFIGRYKAVDIESDAQAAHIFTYIHSNPLDLIEPDWRKGKIIDWENAENFLKNYQWSSLGVYIGTNAYPAFHQLINRGFAENYYKDSGINLDAIHEWGLRNYREEESLYFLE